MIEKVINLYINFCQQAKLLFQIEDKVDLHVEQALDKTFRTFLVEKLKKLIILDFCLFFSFSALFARYCDKIMLNNDSVDDLNNKIENVVAFFKLKVDIDLFMKEYEIVNYYYKYIYSS
jgi:hypothetical protein